MKKFHIQFDGDIVVEAETESEAIDIARAEIDIIVAEEMEEEEVK